MNRLESLKPVILYLIICRRFPIVSFRQIWIISLICNDIHSTWLTFLFCSLLIHSSLSLRCAFLLIVTSSCLCFCHRGRFIVTYSDFTEFSFLIPSNYLGFSLKFLLHSFCQLYNFPSVCHSIFLKNFLFFLLNIPLWEPVPV